ncbi:MAG: glycosyltransferase, partial [Deltaproteobacteria bacterium]|nr:glycosyltransferase [Deltaproteobacteria bacterium]
MRVKSLPLLTFLLDVHPERVVFFLSGDLTPELQHVPFRKLVLARGPLEPPLIDDDVRDMDWLDPETWNDSLSTVIPPLRKGIAIFDISLEGLPPVALDYLALNGFTQLVCYSSEQWVTAKLAPPRVSIRGRLMALRHATIQKLRRGFRIAQRLITPMLRKIQVSIRKALLKGFSKNLHELGVRGFTKEIGHCFRANVPSLVLQADHYGNERSRMVLFDEAIALLPHQSHDLVRGQGLGRFSHWEDEIYFSTPDDTDPNTNGRRYRYIDFSGWRMFLRPLIAFSPSYNVKINRFGAVQLGFGMREVLHNHAPDLPLVRRASRPKPLLTAYAGSTFEREVKKSISRTEPRGFQHLDTEPKEIQLLIGTLGPGGSERQLVYVAKGLHERGYPVRVLSAFHHSAETRHYLPYLEELGISCDFISVPHPRFDQRWLMNAWGLDDLELMELMPDYLAEEVWNLYTHLMVNRPRVLHCWLDHTNIIGAVAGWLAGVPEIVLSTRNLNPTHFPSFFKDWWRKWYKLMAESPRVSFIANSRAGAESYASWLRISPDRFRIIYNGIDSSFIKHPAASDISACRDSFGLSPETPVVLGVFRLAREKQPLIFVHAINELRKTHPTVRGLIAGVGHFEKRVRDEIRALNLGENITLLGRRDDVPTLMTMADVVLLTSAQEGLPNVLMEAQALGRPVVATAVGGVPEVVKHRETGFVCTPGDVQELAGRCRELIDFPEQRATMGHAGAQWIAENFSRESMIAKTVDFYGISAEEQLFLTSEGGKTMSNVGEVMKTDELWTSANPFERDIDDAVTFSLNNAVTQLGFLPGG